MTTTKRTKQPKPKQPIYECQNCGKLSREDALVLPVPHLEERVMPGEPMPAGECPDCGALCHEVEAVLPEFTREDLRHLKIAVTRAMDSCGPNFTELRARFDGLYQKLRKLGA